MATPLRRLRALLHRQEGISLTELSIVSLLLLIVVAPALSFIIVTQKNERIVREATQQQQNARSAVETFSRSMREASYPEGLTYTDSAIFGAAAQNDVTYYSDVDGDSIAERVRYYLNASTATIHRVLTEPNCSQSPCSYTNGATSTNAAIITEVRNADLSACKSSGSQALFTYYQLDPGTGSVTEIVTPAPGIDALVDINYIKITVVADVTPGKSPTCQTVDTTISLRNWRG